VRGRAAGLVLAALLLAVVVLPWRPPTLCVLRGLTGIPCPFCGSTTAMVQLGRADLVEAVRASPLAVIGAPLWTLWPRVGPAVRRRLTARTRWALLAAALVASELWQLQRFLG
jgi:hypothetical protein